jgi:hypothetical protein
MVASYVRANIDCAAESPIAAARITVQQVSLIGDDIRTG